LASPVFTGTPTVPGYAPLAGAAFTGALSLTGVSSSLTLAAGSSTLGPLKFMTGPVLSSPVTGTMEFDGNLLYITGDTTTTGNGRGIVLASQYGEVATGASVASGGAFFTATVRPALIAGHMYKFSYWLKFQKVTAGTLTFSFANSAATTLELGATAKLFVNGAVLAALTNVINVSANLASTTTSAASASIANNAQATAQIEGFVIPTANTRLQLNVTDGAGTVTSRAGSNFMFTDMGAANVGNLG